MIRASISSMLLVLLQYMFVRNFTVRSLLRHAGILFFSWTHTHTQRERERERGAKKEKNRLLYFGVKLENVKERVSRWSPSFPAIHRARARELLNVTCISASVCTCVSKGSCSRTFGCPMYHRALTKRKSSAEKKRQREKQSERRRRNREGGTGWTGKGEAMLRV